MIGVSDGISNGTDGMSYSLQSRDLIADSIETVMGGQWYDGNICIPGCDKNMPGYVIAMARVNRPLLMVYGGTIRAGCSSKGETLEIVSAFQAYGEYIARRITEEERHDIIAMRALVLVLLVVCTRLIRWIKRLRRSTGGACVVLFNPCSLVNYVLALQTRRKQLHSTCTR
ncbi:hypothetical protein PsorP6_003718 [Peronosclerospora sorghi]|uniref:Uncharacterized protein n=1 Tax=Peronosclerospora sorghi TaxID=230839 RepID=A0ACC0VQF9_9STRA|nr:hypothetical protein PsorP6_003718 [Peronosclerospora sorghi]